MHLRGLRWEATEENIQTFLELSHEHISEITIMKNAQGKNNGDAYVVCNEQGAAENALTKHKQCMEGSTRYVEVFKSSDAAMQAGAGVSGKGQWDGVVKLRGFQYSSTEDDVKQFLTGLMWMDGGITIPLNERGQCAGEAYVQFEDYSNANSCMERNRNEVNGRYIECFKSSNNDMRIAIIKSMKAKFGTVQPMGMQQQMMPQQAWGGLNMGPGGNMGGGPMGGFGGMKQEVGGFGGNRGGFGGRPGPY